MSVLSRVCCRDLGMKLTSLPLTRIEPLIVCCRTTDKEEEEKRKKEKKEKKEKERVKKSRKEEDEDGGEWETVKGGVAIPSEKPKMFAKDAEIDIPIVIKKLNEIVAARGNQPTLQQHVILIAEAQLESVCLYVLVFVCFRQEADRPSGANRASSRTSERV